jgi:septum formation protein
VTLVDAEGRARHRLSTSVVAFKRLSGDELDAYLASDEWRGKAGGYAIQGRAEALCGCCRAVIPG